jgi:hypothetical protein
MLATNVLSDDNRLCMPDVVGRYLRYAIRADCRICAATVSQEGSLDRLRVQLRPPGERSVTPPW